MTSDPQILSRRAVEAALAARWQDALDLNLMITDLLPNDTPTLNRLAKAYEETGQIKLAKKTYDHVLKLDKYNRIASNNLSRLKHVDTDVVTVSASSSSPGQSSPFSFIEEPGKTKNVTLTKLAPQTVIAQLRHGQSVKLKANNRRISVTTLTATYLGALPDDLAIHLIKLLKAGYQYEAAVKTVSPTNVEVFIHETKKSARLKGLPSFPSKDTKYYYQFLPTEPIAESPLELTDGEYSEG